MRTTIKGLDDDSENEVVFSVAVVEGEIVGTLHAGDGESGAWLNAAQLREVARESLRLADRLGAANEALKGGTP